MALTKLLSNASVCRTTYFQGDFYSRYRTILLDPVHLGRLATFTTKERVKAFMEEGVHTQTCLNIWQLLQNMKVHFTWASFLLNIKHIIAISISYIPYFYETTMYQYRQPKRWATEGKPDTGPFITLITPDLRRILSHHVVFQPPAPTTIIKLMKPVEKSKSSWRNLLRHEPRRPWEPQRKLCIKPGSKKRQW